MVFAICCIVLGVALIMAGFVLGMATWLHAVERPDRRLYGVLTVFFLLWIPLGFFVEFYCGWWGVIRAIIDYVKHS